MQRIKKTEMLNECDAIIQSQLAAGIIEKVDRAPTGRGFILQLQGSGEREHDFHQNACRI